MKGDYYKIFSLIFFVLGFFLMLGSDPVITGALAGNEVGFSLNFGFVVGFLFVFTSLSLFIEGKYIENKIEFFHKADSSPGLMELLNEKLRPILEDIQKGRKEIYISQEGWDRVLKEPYVRANLDSYVKEIEKITSFPSKVNASKIGDFRVTSTKGKKEKIAWRYETGKSGIERVYIDDLLFKDNNNKSLGGGWEKKAKGGEITANDYTRHRPFEGF